MKVKFLPEDFLVEELPTLEMAPTGMHSFYRLTKESITTPDAIRMVSDKWKLSLKRFSYAGLKDKHAQTIQYFTIRNGPAENLKQPHLEVAFLGKVHHAYNADDFAANRFHLILRDMTLEELARAEERLEEVRRHGVANYFDDQRFGSVSPGEPFIARELIEGRFDTALRIAVSRFYEFDRKDLKREKGFLRANWGDWEKCHARVKTRDNRIIINHLYQHPSDFLGAFARIPLKLQELYLGAYQAHLWNRLLAKWVSRASESVSLLHLKLGDFPTPNQLRAESQSLWETLEIPLPSARLRLSLKDPLKPLVEEVMQEEGLELASMKIDAMRRPYFSKSIRPARVMAANVESRCEPDEHHPKKQKLRMSFDLPRGAYATILVKRLTDSRSGD